MPSVRGSTRASGSPDVNVPSRRASRAALLTGVALLLSIAALGAAAPWVAPVDPFAIAGEPLQPPGGAHPLGTDDLGRDLWSGIVHGAANAVLVGAAAAGAAAVLGLTIGGLAATRGGVVDTVLMGGTDFVQSLPRFFLIVTVVALFGSHLLLVVLVLGLTAWPSTARVFRAQLLTVMHRDFVLAARASGATDLAVLMRHALPVTAAVVAAQVSYQAGGAILTEAGLSFLGLGDPSIVSWGTLLASARHLMREAWWMSLFPGLAVCAAVLGCNLIADAIADRG